LTESTAGDFFVSARQRLVLRLVIDGAGWVVGLLLALVVRYDGLDGFSNNGAWGGLVAAGALAVVLSAVITAVVRKRYGRTVFGSFEDVRRLTVVNAAVAVCLLMVNRFFTPRLVPDSVVLGGLVAACVFSFGARYTWRLWYERRSRPGKDAERVLVFGAGEGGEQTITAMLRDPESPYLPVALLDDDPAKKGLLVRGVPVVGGRGAIAATAQRKRATSLVIAVPGAGSSLIREVADLGTDVGLSVRVLPRVAELFGAPIGVDDIRPLTENDLLGRAAIDTDVDAIAGYLHGRRVLVTGAGGSIGSEICRQVTRFGPAELVALDRDESALHALQLDLDGRAMLDTRNLVVADIRDRLRMAQVMQEHQPQVVFHAAALKHLPLLEMHPNEAVKSNVFGTKNVLDAAGAVGVERFVNISTDKAAEPISALGCSKRLAEGLTAAAAHTYSGTFLSVRFGNVLGSRGSVLTAFDAQIARGGPVTVTHPDVTRYFMTITESVQLVVQAGALGNDGEALVLDMGEPVRIADVAKQLIKQSPRPVDIVYTGLRPGEKLNEVLLAEGEDDHRPAHPLISHVRVPPLADVVLDSFVGLETDDEVAEHLRVLARTAMNPLGAPAESPRRVW